MMEAAILFFFAVVTQMCYALPQKWPLFVLFPAMLGAMCIGWQKEHQWVGWMNPAFASALGAMVIAMIIGIVVGGVILKYWPKE